MIITGLRGVGKTALLGAFREIALGHHWVAIEAEISKKSDFADRIARHIRRALHDISPRDRWQSRARRAAEVLKSFSMKFSPDGSVSTSFDVDPSRGIGDSGDLSDDLTDVLVALGEAAQEAGTGVVILLDEVQYLSAGELEALIAALHKTVQRALPLTVVAAGLPQIPRLAAEAKSYSERLFTFPAIGELGPLDAALALTHPAQEEGITFEDAAVDAIVAYTAGYPYFIQEFGNVIWDRAQADPIGLQDVTDAIPLVEGKLDESFFRARAERATYLEMQYMRAMAQLGPGAQKAADVARVLRRTSAQLGPTRSSLIGKGLLYTPSRGLAAFTVPQFDSYLVRNYPLEVPSSPVGKRRRQENP
jgi:hypothetical protein